MRAANIVVGVITTLWLALFLIGRDLTHGVYLHGPGFAPNAGQIDYYIVYPLVAVVALVLAGWVGNMWRKPVIIFIPSLVVGFTIVPFLLGFTGGM